ncbi:MAG: nucleotidyltransferase domain-containing protein [Pseudomonadota bacterium]
MSVVTYQHRMNNVSGDIAAYNETLMSMSAFLRTFDWISSLIICGSYAKGSLAPGWSDLDLVVVYTGEMTRERLDAVRLADGRNPNPRVPVGIDFVRDETLARTRRIIGRPLAMSLELAQYARPVFGPNHFTDLAREPGDAATVARESEVLVRADANSWLRRSMNGYHSADAELFDAAKTLLRIAMFESSPLRPSGFAVADYCNAVRAVVANENICEAFSLCEDLRLGWSVRPSDEAWIQANLERLTPALLDYCEAWKPFWS